MSVAQGRWCPCHSNDRLVPKSGVCITSGEGERGGQELSPFSPRSSPLLRKFQWQQTVKAAPELYCRGQERLTPHLTQTAAWTGVAGPLTHRNATTAFWRSPLGARGRRCHPRTKPLPSGSPRGGAWPGGPAGRAALGPCARGGPGARAVGRAGRQCRGSTHTRVAPRAAPPPPLLPA